MHERDRRNNARVAQIAVVTANLISEQEAFVDDRARRHRRHEIFLAMLELQRLDLVARGLANHVKLALQRVGDHYVGATADEDLPDHRLAVLDQRRHRHVAIQRHISPAQHDLTLGAYGAFQLLLARQPRRVLAWQEDHADAILTLRRQSERTLGKLLAIKRVRNLNQHAGAVAA